MANRISTVLALALVVSLGLNGYLWLRSPDTSAKRESVAPREPVATHRAPDPGRSAEPGPGGQVVVGEVDADRQSCDQVLAECREKQSALQREVADLLPPRKRFEMAVPDPDLEARFKPELARLLSGYDYDLECRTGICRVEIMTPEGADPNEWMMKVQDDERLVGMAPRRSFESGRPTSDPVSGEALNVQRMYLTARDPDAVAAVDVLQPLVDALESSGAVDDCARRHPDDRGTLRYRLRILADEGKVIADYGGDLYATDAGRCIARAQTKILPTAEVPAKVSGRPLYHEVTLPRGPEPDSLSASAATPARPSQATRAR